MELKIESRKLMESISGVMAGRKMEGTAPRLLLAAQPKSASTWVSGQLSAITGLQQASLVPGYGGREQELSELRLCMFGEIGYVACHHLRWSGVSNRLIDQFGLKTVVLVRNLYDVVVSSNDHLDREGSGGGSPMMWLEPEFLRRSPEDRLDALIDLLVPWHLQFFLSWSRSGRRDVQWLTYEVLFQNDPVALLRQVCVNAGIPVQAEARGEELKAQARFNVGVSGRGKEQLSAAQIARIQTLAGHYRGCDFSLLGL